MLFLQDPVKKAVDTAAELFSSVHEALSSLAGFTKNKILWDVAQVLAPLQTKIDVFILCAVVCYGVIGVM